MAYSTALAERIRTVLGPRRDIAEKKMFGGIVFLLNGNMLVGVWRQSLSVRLGPEQGAAALKQPFVREFDITGRPMRAWVLVEPEGVDLNEQLRGWIAQAETFVRTLPSK